MQPIVLALLVVMAAQAPAAPPAQPPCSPTVTGELRIETFQSVVYSDRRTVRVWLPPGYGAAESAKRQYPVLYMLDGQGAFDDCTAFKKERELQVDETATRLIAERKIPPIIVVGIDSSGRRNHEYAPYRDVLVEPAAPEPIGRELPGFVVNEVLAHVGRNYRVTAEPRLTAIAGASLGGLAALYVLLNRPDRFGMGLLESPTLPQGNGQMLRDTAFLARGPDRVYIGIGATEMAVPGGDEFVAKLRIPMDVGNAGLVKMSEKLAANLRAAFLNRPEVTLVVEPAATHNSTSWARRLPRALVTLFGERPR